MQLGVRAYRGEEDYWRIRAFLREVFQCNGRRERSWSVVRFDYWRWHGVENIEHHRLEEVIFIWENWDGRIAAVLNPEGAGEAFFQVHPNFRTPALEEEMLTVAELMLATPAPGGGRQLRVWANEQDGQRQAMLRRRGYSKGEWPEYQRRRSLSGPVADALPAAGYSVRALGDVDELPARSLVSWRVFHADEPDSRYEGWAWYHNVQRAPLYRRDLDLVAVAPDGELASFCTVWFDDVTRTGVFEPVGTAPAHQRRGLGRAVMCEGLRRLQRLGATMATVGSYSEAAGALYAAVGFTEYDLLERWSKHF
ncbi:MAG TPA: GNAT family N-acetyltransferase [Caldilineaceae bacterium]|nr:GNAT family N-acetyltransferase [Caldilineaceae bacterium]